MRAKSIRFGQSIFADTFSRIAKSQADLHITTEIIRWARLIPRGQFTTYGSIAAHINIVPRRVAGVLPKLSDAEAAELYPGIGC